MKKKEKRTFKQFFMDNNKRNLKITITVVCVVLALAIIGGGIYIGNKLGLITIDHGSNGDPEGTFAPEEQFDAMYDVSDASSIDSLITAWAKNGGAKYSSKNIINVLLLGVDSETGKAEGGRSDAIILLSLNKKTKTITLVSFLRDCYTYMNINGSERCCKTNHAYFWGGPAALIETLENNYKIEIDHYISVDFKSFPKLIDSLGGVSVPIEPYEADYINRTTTKIKKISAGDSVKLSGNQALVYSRIRHVDNEGDVGRTARQRTVIMALIKSAQNASAGQLNNALDIVLPNVVTNYKRSEILSLMTQALSQGWMNYEIKQIVMPTEGNYTSAQLYTYYGKIINQRLSVWVVDYPVVARELQLALYGDTNIKIGDNHVSAVDLLKKGAVPSSNNSGSGSYSASTRPHTDVGTVAESEEPVTHEHTSEAVSELTEAESTTRRFPFTLPDFGSTSPAEDEDAA